MISLYLVASMTLAGLQSPNPNQAKCGFALVAIVLFTFIANLGKFLINTIAKIVNTIRMRKLRTAAIKP